MKPAYATFWISIASILTLAPDLATADVLGAGDGTVEGIAYFEKHVRPVFAKHCYACHSEKRQKREGGLVLDRRAGWTTGGDSGAAVIPGDAKASLLIRAIRYADSDLQMPPDNRLSEQTVARLEQWVRMGARGPADGAEQTDEKWTDPSDPVAGQSHWAFQPIAVSRPAAVGMLDWPNSAIDSFILSRLETEQLDPSDVANRRDLIRRASFQLIGLPPGADVVAEFTADDRPDAYERQIDRLLASPHFGERWGRHWLDLARYADSNGLDENFLFREAWRYRNRVIDTVNADMPFDRFLVEQIAGDLLPFESIEQRDRQRISAGFLVVGPKVLLGNNADQRVMDVADEQLDTIGRAVLGQTLGCARCHDHKFDPIPTADYYALAGIFTSTNVMQRRHMLNQQRNMERLAGLGSEGDTVNAAYETFWRERPKLQQRQTHAKSALTFLKEHNEAAFKDLAAKHPDAIAEPSSDARQTPEQRVQAQRKLLESIVKSLTNPPKIPPRAMIPADVEEPADEAIRIAGQFDHKGTVVPRGVLRVFDNKSVTIPKHHSGRLELAQWLTDAENGSGNLAARVLANRVWHHVIGRGIVRTVDSFGRTGESPSHPRLLDHLSGRLLESGWSIKSVVRRVILSRTFVQSSRFDSTGHTVDPENRLLWRAHRRRLDPESLRDAMLHAAGTLDDTRLDSTVAYLGDQATAVGENKNRRRTDYPNRSIYLPVIRNDLPELFEAFDFADPHATTGLRADTLVAMQGLFLMNDDAVMYAADSVARRIARPEADAETRVRSMYRLILNAEVDSTEEEEMLAFIERAANNFVEAGQEDADLKAWSIACHALFASSRFQTLE